MWTIENLFRNAYLSIKSILKRLYQSWAVLISGTAMFAMVLLNEQNFQGAGNSEIVIKYEYEETEEKEEEQNREDAPGFTVAYKKLLEQEQNQMIQKYQAEISRQEVAAACASIMLCRNELQLDPVNPYGDIQVTQEDYESLCRIVQAEAGGEDVQGKVLVAEVVLNRVLSEKFASTVYDVVFERNGGSPQFSPTVDGRYFSVTVMPETIEAVEQALHGEDFSQGALFFSARGKANPYDMAWFDRNLKWLFQHGGHEFYTLP